MSKKPTVSPSPARPPKSLRVRKETVRDLSAGELAAVAGGYAMKTSQSQICNKTTTGSL